MPHRHTHDCLLPIHFLDTCCWLRLIAETDSKLVAVPIESSSSDKVILISSDCDVLLSESLLVNLQQQSITLMIDEGAKVMELKISTSTNIHCEQFDNIIHSRIIPFLLSLNSLLIHFLHL